MASLRCIRQALHIFSPYNTLSSQEIQVARGVWGFLPYATQYWFVMLRNVAANAETACDSNFVALAMATSTSLGTSCTEHDFDRPDTDIEGLRSMKRFTCLWYDAVIGLHAQTNGMARLSDSQSQGECARGR